MIRIQRFENPSLARLASILLICALGLPTHARADAAGSPTASATISVSGENGKTQSFDFAALDKLPQQQVHAQAHGSTVDCSGPAIIDVLAPLGVASGEALRGKNLAMYVRISAADGYRVVFALAELDPGMRDNVPILTHQCDGKNLDAKDGPIRVVVPGDKRPARWIRQVTAIDVMRTP